MNAVEKANHINDKIGELSDSIGCDEFEATARLMVDNGIDIPDFEIENMSRKLGKVLLMAIINRGDVIINARMKAVPGVPGIIEMWSNVMIKQFIDDEQKGEWYDKR